jgi:hypothetical protein
VDSLLSVPDVYQAEVDGEVQEMRAALDAQHAAEVAEINQCLEKVR